MFTSPRHLACPVVGRAAVIEAMRVAAADGLSAGFTPILLAGSSLTADVRSALGSHADAVTVVHTDEHARNPGRITSMLYRFGTVPDGRHAIVIRELDLVGRSSAGLAEQLLGDCLINTPTLQALPLSFVCVADVEGLGREDLIGLHRCHPAISGLAENHHFDAAWATELHASSLPEPPVDAPLIRVEGHSLATLRTFVCSVADGHGLAPDRVDDLVLAANEAVTNSLRYGGGYASVRVWRDGGALICEIRDHGYLRDPLTGRLPPALGTAGGRGLWLVHHLCDLVQLRSSDRGGTTVRLYVEK